MDEPALLQNAPLFDTDFEEAEEFIDFTEADPSDAPDDSEAVQNAAVMPQDILEMRSIYGGTIYPDLDYEDDCVMVVMKRAYGGVNKVCEPGYFGSLFTHYDDISRMEGRDPNEYPEDYPLLNFGNFHQILKLYLVNPGRESVLEAIEYLSQREDILSAEPRYINIHLPVPVDPPGDGSGEQDSSATPSLPPTGDTAGILGLTLVLSLASLGVFMVTKNNLSRGRVSQRVTGTCNLTHCIPSAMSGIENRLVRLSGV